jgi:hypothetical protein
MMPKPFHALYGEGRESLNEGLQSFATLEEARAYGALLAVTVMHSWVEIDEWLDDGNRVTRLAWNTGRPVEIEQQEQSPFVFQPSPRGRLSMLALRAA